MAAIQLSIMLGAAHGGLLLGNISIAAPLLGGTALLVLASLVIGNGNRLESPASYSMRSVQTKWQG